LLLLRMRGAAASDKTYARIRCQFDVTGHVFSTQVIEASLRWLIEKDIIAKRARIALRLVDREHLFFWGGNHVAASY
jgi:hypothetical protein